MIIRKLEKSDLGERVAWMNRPEVFKTMHFTPPITLENTVAWFEKNMDVSTRCDMAFEDNAGNLVAMGGLTNIDYTTRKAEFYIFVNPSRQREGIGTEATKLLCQYGFEVLNLHKIYLFTNNSNLGGRRTYEKVGFKLEGVHRDEMITNDKFDNRLYYGLLADELNSNGTNLIIKGGNSIILERYKLHGFDFSVVRDDLYPQIGGGIKSRKSAYYEAHMLKCGYNACVTTGGIQSNHNRAIALMCAKNGWRCHLVYHGTKERFDSEKGNALLVRKSGATVEFVDANQIGPAMDAAMERLKSEGYNPMYIHGGGHDIPGGVALVEAVKSLKKQCDKNGYKPDYIFHASGTGSTQAGIAVGLDLVGWTDVKLVGISVARQKERGTQVIEDFANMLAEYYGLNSDYNGNIIFNTDYLCGGYEQYTPKMAEYLDIAMKETGLMFDTTYSGKAFYGMMDYIKTNKISDNVLFWHTGGLMNLTK